MCFNKNIRDKSSSLCGFFLNYGRIFNKIQPKKCRRGIFVQEKAGGAEEVMLELNTKNSSI